MGKCKQSSNKAWPTPAKQLCAEPPPVDCQQANTVFTSQEAKSEGKQSLCCFNFCLNSMFSRNCSHPYTIFSPRSMRTTNNTARTERKVTNFISVYMVKVKYNTSHLQCWSQVSAEMWHTAYVQLVWNLGEEMWIRFQTSTWRVTCCIGPMECWPFTLSIAGATKTDWGPVWVKISKLTSTGIKCCCTDDVTDPSATYASKFLFVYRCLLHSQSCDQPRSIFTSISFSLRWPTIWGQEVLLRTVQ